MKLLGSNKSMTTKDESDENVPHLEITGAEKFVIKLLVHCIFKSLNSEFSYLELWLTDQNSKSLDIEDKHCFSY